MGYCRNGLWALFYFIAALGIWKVNSMFMTLMLIPKLEYKNISKEKGEDVYISKLYCKGQLSTGRISIDCLCCLW